MGVDTAIHLECEAKTTLGEGDALGGTRSLVKMLKARSHAQTMERISAREDVPLAILEVKRVIETPEGRKQTKVKHADLLEIASPLEGLSDSCAGCPANLTGNGFGCVGFMNYPITGLVERWLMARVPGAERLGGALFRRAIEDMDYDGAPVAGWRERGLFESPLAAHAGDVNADQLFHALLAVGGGLDPFHGLLFLLWIEAIEVDGEVPRDPRDPEPLQRLRSARDARSRMEVSRLQIGAPSDDEPLHQLQLLLVALYRCWVLEVPLLVDA